MSISREKQIASRPTTKIRRRVKPKPDVPTENGKSMEVILQYSNGKSIEDIAELLGWEEDSIRVVITRHFHNLKMIIETEALVKAQGADGGANQIRSSKRVKTFKNQKKIDENISEDFLERLSDPDDRVLSNEEVMFCYLCVHEGDAKKALIDSDLAEGLTKSASGYNRACKLRILMLKGKKNIIKYINSLQIDYAKEININKEVIQTTIIQQLEQLKEQNDPRNSATIAKLTEQLGRTVGAFSDKIVIEEVSFDDAMDRMLDMRKERTKKLESEGAPSETFVYDPDLIG